MSEFKLSAITYISGYVVQMVEKVVPCSKCRSTLQIKNIQKLVAPKLVNKKLRGRLILGSKDVIQVCRDTEIVISKIKSLMDGKLPNCENLSTIVENQVIQQSLKNE